jgi:surface protein
MRLFTFLAVFFFGFIASAQTADDFVIEIDNPNNFNFTYAFELNTTGLVRIDWGDGNTSLYSSSSTGNVVSHTYSASGIYTIVFDGDLESFEFYFASRIPLDIKQWGTSQWTTMNRAFAAVEQLTISATDSPDLSQLTDMSQMFYGVADFNSDISNWDVSNVTTMDYLFWRVSNYNQPLDSWDVSNVTSMLQMFTLAVSFNQPLNSWDVSSVTSMAAMFSAAQSFNQPLDNWDVSNVVHFGIMFSDATAFDQPLDNWNVSRGQFMYHMFDGATVFNQPLNSWYVSNVTAMNNMFENAVMFNQPISDWDISSVTDFLFMFRSATSFNQSLMNWDIGTFAGRGAMFDGASSFNQNVATWELFQGPYRNMVNNTALDIDNYDNLLAYYVFQGSANQIAEGIGLEYCDEFSRNLLLQRGWTISGDSQASICPNNAMEGKIQLDYNNNGCDINDSTISNIQLEISNGSSIIYIYTDAQGDYSLNINDGTYTITPIVDANVNTVTPSSVSLTVNNGLNNVQDFCVGSAVLINDLEISILPLEDARPGFDTNYKLIYKNKGNTRLSGSLDFTYQDDFMDLLTTNPATTSSSVGMLSWDFVDLDPFETREIEFTMNLNTPTDPTFPLISGDLLDFSATINPTSNDDTPLDNVFALQQVVVNSYDPNDKTCLQGETILPTMVGEYVHYRIRFENEGTASAVNVRIVDYIDTTKFDIATLMPLSASHDYTTKITEGNKVEFVFDNIMLPFTAPASQGYVLFKIKTVDTLVLGDDFSNQAEIYFDFNFPIITNLETTTVAVPLSLNENNLLEVRFFPNPAQNTISLTSNMEFNEYSIYDTLGAIVSQEKFDAATVNKNILVDHLVSGLYFVEVRGDQGSTVIKMIKE